MEEKRKIRTFKWSDALLIGNEQIDSQHKELIDRINHFILFLRDEKAEGASAQRKEEAVKVFKYLNGYIVEHFLAEERLMLKNDYPLLVSHREHHSQIMCEVLDCRRELIRTGISVKEFGPRLKTLLLRLVEHISTTDKELAVYLKIAPEM